MRGGPIVIGTALAAALVGGILYTRQTNEPAPQKQATVVVKGIAGQASSNAPQASTAPGNNIPANSGPLPTPSQSRASVSRATVKSVATAAAPPFDVPVCIGRGMAFDSKIFEPSDTDKTQWSVIANQIPPNRPCYLGPFHALVPQPGGGTIAAGAEVYFYVK